MQSLCVECELAVAADGADADAAAAVTDRCRHYRAAALLMMLMPLNAVWMLVFIYAQHNSSSLFSKIFNLLFFHFIHMNTT